MFFMVAKLADSHCQQISADNIQFARLCHKLKYCYIAKHVSHMLQHCRNLFAKLNWYNSAMNAMNHPMNLETRILIVDDDPGIRSLISSFLEKYGYVTETACDPVQMRERLGQSTYDLIVLDVMMPREDGLTALQDLRKNSGPPVIMLSAVGGDVDRIVGLEMGAEDYLAKPCNPRELLARIRTVLRRREAGGQLPGNASTNVVPFVLPDSADVLQFSGWKMDMVSRLLHDPNGVPVTLSDGEFRLMRAFVEHPRRVLTRDQLLDFARGEESEHYDRAIDVQVSRLRRKLASTTDSSELIRTVRNEGYMFMPVVNRPTLLQS
jgi:two-component system, OmpR family, response regulator